MCVHFGKYIFLNEKERNLANIHLLGFSTILFFLLINICSIFKYSNYLKYLQ